MKKSFILLLTVLLSVVLMSACAKVAVPDDPASSGTGSFSSSAASVSVSSSAEPSSDAAQTDSTASQSESEPEPETTPEPVVLYASQKNGTLSLEDGQLLDVDDLYYTRVFGRDLHDNELPYLYQYRHPYIYYHLSADEDEDVGAATRVTVGRYNMEDETRREVTIYFNAGTLQNMAVLDDDHIAINRMAVDAATGNFGTILSVLDFETQSETQLLMVPAASVYFNSAHAQSESEAVFVTYEGHATGTQRAVYHYDLRTEKFTELYRGPIFNEETPDFSDWDVSAVDTYDGKIWMIMQRRVDDEIQTSLREMDGAGNILSEQLLTQLKTHRRTDDIVERMVVTDEGILLSYARWARKVNNYKETTAILQRDGDRFNLVRASTLTAKLSRCETSADVTSGPVYYDANSQGLPTAVVMYDPATLTLTELKLQTEDCTEFMVDTQGNLLLATRTNDEYSSWYLYPAEVLAAIMQAAK